MEILSPLGSFMHFPKTYCKNFTFFRPDCFCFFFLFSVLAVFSRLCSTYIEIYLVSETNEQRRKSKRSSIDDTMCVYALWFGAVWFSFALLCMCGEYIEKVVCATFVRARRQVSWINEKSTSLLYDCHSPSEASNAFHFRFFYQI